MLILKWKEMGGGKDLSSLCCLHMKMCQYVYIWQGKQCTLTGVSIIRRSVWWGKITWTALKVNRKKILKSKVTTNKGRHFYSSLVPVKWVRELSVPTVKWFREEFITQIAQVVQAHGGHKHYPVSLGLVLRKLHQSWINLEWVFPFYIWVSLQIKTSVGW